MTRSSTSLIDSSPRQPGRHTAGPESPSRPPGSLCGLAARPARDLPRARDHLAGRGRGSLEDHGASAQARDEQAGVVAGTVAHRRVEKRIRALEGLPPIVRRLPSPASRFPCRSRSRGARPARPCRARPGCRARARSSPGRGGGRLRRARPAEPSGHPRRSRARPRAESRRRWVTGAAVGERAFFDLEWRRRPCSSARSRGGPRAGRDPRGGWPGRARRRRAPGSRCASDPSPRRRRARDRPRRRLRAASASPPRARTRRTSRPPPPSRARPSGRRRRCRRPPSSAAPPGACRAGGGARSHAHVLDRRAAPPRSGDGRWRRRSSSDLDRGRLLLRTEFTSAGSRSSPGEVERTPDRPCIHKSGA